MQATKVFEDPHVFRAPAKPGKDDGEERWRKTGSIESSEALVTVIYTMRDNGATIRLISARLASDMEEREYDDNKNQS